MNINLKPEFQNTPKRNKPTRAAHKMGTIFHNFATANGGRVEITETNLETLAQQGLPSNRLAMAAHELRKFYGVTVNVERSGRKASAYVIS